MKKVALINMYPFEGENQYANKITRYSAYAFDELGMHSEFFSFSDKNKTSEVYGFKQHEIKSFRPLGDKFGAARYLDFIFLVLFGFRPTIEFINHSPALLRELDNYKPDIIFAADCITAKLMKKYLDQSGNQNVKMMCFSDSCKGIEAEIDDAIDWLKINKGNPILLKFIDKVLRGRYVKYYLSIYGLQVSITDAFLATDDMHRKEISRQFPKFRKNIFALYPEWWEPKSTKPKKIKGKIKSILFIGSYGHIPNAIAMKNITEFIAPKLPDKKFVIFGRGCPNKKIGNVQFIDGTKMSSDGVLRDADVCISPIIGYVSGIKTKISDYMEASKIVIGTKLTFTGYRVVDGFNSIIEDKIDRYPDRISQLDRNHKLRDKIQKNANTALDGHYKPDVIKKWATILKHIFSSSPSRGV